MAALAGTLLSAADASKAAAQTFAEDLAVTEVEVPVQVLVDGKPLRGLAQDDFELLVDGEPQELSWFEAIETAPPGAPAAATATATSPSAAPRPEPAAPWRRHYLLLFDFGFSAGPKLDRAIAGARRMTGEQLDPSDRVAIALFSQAVGARILVPFTADRRGIGLGLDFLEVLLDGKTDRTVEALEALDAWWAGAFDREALPRPLLADLGDRAATLIQPLARSPDLAGFGLPIARAGAGRYKKARLDAILALGGGSLSAVRSLGRSLASLVTLLRDVPEPKHLLFLSEGLGGGLFGGDTRTSVLFRLKPMLDAFGSTGWTLQALDIGGIRPPPSTIGIGPEDFDSSVEVGGRAIASTAGFDNSSLFYLANETGGELYENYNRIDRATGKLLDRTRAIYLLAFQPAPELIDGRRHEIEVRLVPKIRGARLRHRASFEIGGTALERPLTERRMDAAELALTGRVLAELPATAMLLPLPGRGSLRVPLFVEVPIEPLDAGRKRKKKIRLDLHAYALDGAGAVRAGLVREIKFRPAGERTLLIADELELPPEVEEVRLLAWDLRGGRRHLSSLELTPPPAPVLLAPLIVAPGERRRALPPADLEPGSGLALLETATALGLPDLRPEIVRGRSRRLVVLAAGVASGAGAAARLAVVRDEPEAAPAGAFELPLERLPGGSDGTLRFAGVVETAALEPGAYRLEAALDIGDGTTLTSRTSFSVIDAADAAAPMPREPARQERR